MAFATEIHDVSWIVFFLSNKSLLDFITLKQNSFLTLLHYLYKTGLDTLVSEPETLYRFVAFILDIGFHRFLKPVYVKGQDKEKKIIFFRYRLSKKVYMQLIWLLSTHEQISFVFQRQIPIISYPYTSPMASKSSIIEVYCRTPRLWTSRLNQLAVLVSPFHSNWFFRSRHYGRFKHYRKRISP